MSARRVADLGHEWPEDEIALACGRCFYCGEEIQAVVVYWYGSLLNFKCLALHPTCASHLARHLAKDSLAGEKMERVI